MRIPGFTENWFGDPSCDALATLARSVADVPGLIVEVGSWEGRSTCALANAVWPRRVQAVDTWAGSPSEVSAELAAKRDVFAQWWMNVHYWTKGNVDAHRMDWREFVPAVTEPIALCFIDAEHTYREVADNIDAVLPLMATGGVICGDDVHHPPVRDAVRDKLGSFVQTATLWVHRV